MAWCAGLWCLSPRGRHLCDSTVCGLMRLYQMTPVMKMMKKMMMELPWMDPVVTPRCLPTPATSLGRHLLTMRMSPLLQVADLIYERHLLTPPTPLSSDFQAGDCLLDKTKLHCDDCSSRFKTHLISFSSFIDDVAYMAVMMLRGPLFKLT